MNNSASFYGDTPVRIVSPQLVNHFNKTQAIFIHQLHYWLQKEQGIIHDGKRWIYNTASDWAEQIMVCERQAKRIIADLKKKGVLLVEKLSKYKSDRTNYVTINYEVLSELMTQSSNGKEIISETAKISPVFDDKLSLSSGQNVPMVLQRVQTNNKDHLIEKRAPSQILQKPKTESKQVEQVKKNMISEKRKEEGRGMTISSVPQKTTTAQDMLSVWNSTFQKSQTNMSKDLAPRLVAAFKVKFDSNIEKWKHYCKTIETSGYIMGENFSLSIFWALNFSTIDRIRGGEWGVKQIPVLIENIENTVQDHISALREPEECISLRKKIIKTYGLARYWSWFKTVELYIENAKIRFRAPSQWQESYIISHFQELRV